MNLFQRLLLTIYCLSLTIISVIVFLVSLNIIQDDSVYYIIDSLYNDIETAVIAIVSSIVFIVLSLWFLTLSFRGTPKASGIHQFGEFGDIIITIDTLESIAIKAARKVKGVKDLKARVKQGETEAGIRIGLRITVDGESSIPEIIELLQQNVKSHTEEITGVSVETVTVVVENTIQSTPSRGRVE